MPDEQDPRTFWFGEPWGADICIPDSHIDTPQGKTCPYCSKLIVEGDQGLAMEHMDPFGYGSTPGNFGHVLCILFSFTGNPDPTYVPPGCMAWAPPPPPPPEEPPQG